MTYTMTCSCGDKMEFDGATRDEAVKKCQTMMDEKTIEAHMKEKHSGDAVMSVVECHSLIENQLQPAA